MDFFSSADDYASYINLHGLADKKDDIPTDLLCYDPVKNIKEIQSYLFRQTDAY